MSGPALSKDAIEARRKAAADAEMYARVNGPEIRAAHRAARLEAIAVKCAPLNRRILQGRRAIQKRRAAAKLAKASRRRNRA